MTREDAKRELLFAKRNVIADSYIDQAYDVAIKALSEPALKESQEPKTFRVYDITTGKEADPCEIALHEDWAKNLIYCDMEGFAVQEDGTLILMDECGNYAYCPEGRFKVVWDE